MLETSNFVHGSAMRSLNLVVSECSLSGHGQGHVSSFYIVDLITAPTDRGVRVARQHVYTHAKLPDRPPTVGKPFYGPAATHAATPADKEVRVSRYHANTCEPNYSATQQR